MSEAETSITEHTQQINQLCFQVGQLKIQNEINDNQIIDLTSRAISLAKKVESLKANLPKEKKDDQSKDQGISSGSLGDPQK